MYYFKDNQPHKKSLKLDTQPQMMTVKIKHMMMEKRCWPRNKHNAKTKDDAGYMEDQNGHNTNGVGENMVADNDQMKTELMVAQNHKSNDQIMLVHENGGQKETITDKRVAGE